MSTGFSPLSRRSTSSSKHSASGRSSWSALLLAAAVGTTLLFPSYSARAQETATAAPAVDKKLQSLAEDFLYYSIIANDQLAKDNGTALLNAAKDPRDLLMAVEAAAGDRDVPSVLERNQRRDALKDISKQISDKLEEGRRSVARDPARIKADIARLDNSPRANLNASGHLTAAGPFAVPYYLQTLQDSRQTSLHPYVLKLMVQVGNPLIQPLVQELQTPNVAQKIMVVDILGQIGYPQAAPFLKQIAADANSTGPLKSAAESALAKCDPRGVLTSLTPAEGFYSLALAVYNKNPAGAAPFPDEPMNPAWYYDKNLDNVVAVPVPTPIWNSLEAMRLSERSLQLDAGKPQATSLWIASNLRREILLAGAKDPTRLAGMPDASFYAVAAGPVYLNPVLQMAITAHDSPLVLKTIDALEATGGTQGLVSQREGATPLVKALSYPDRAVRFHAAFALGRANPATDFSGFTRVIPVLSEAVSQTGSASVLLVYPDQLVRNRIKGVLEKASPAYTVYDADSLGAALETARKASAFDAVIIPADNTANQVKEFSNVDYRLAAAPTILMTDHDMADATATVVKPDVDDKALLTAITSAGSHIGQTPIDEAGAKDYSLTAIKILGNLARDHACIYNVNDAEPALSDCLKDKRPDVITAAAEVLGQMNNHDAQTALASAALASKDNALRTSLFTALAESARRTGNALDPATVDGIIKLVADKGADAGVRNTAAAALGALNVPSNQASTLILQQVR